MFGRATRRRQGCAIAGVLVLLWPGISWADDLADLKALVKEQSEQIGALQDQVRKLEDESTGPLPRQVVDTIDQRIIDFENHPTSKLLISGYGAAGYNDPQDGDGSFGMLFVPIFHYQLSERLHLTGEVEFDLRGDELEIGVEYAQIDFLVNDYLTITGGKFLLPFNAFSQRIHPAWINKLPSLPPIYGRHGSGGGIVPVLSDTGLNFSGGLRLPWLLGKEEPRINYAFYVTNGPRIEPESEFDERFEDLAEFLEDDGVIMSADDLLDTLDIGHGGGTEIEFGETFSDNNSNKALGGRLGLLPIPSLEVGGSFMRGKFDDRGDLDFRMFGFDAGYKVGPFDFRGEYINLEFDREGGGTERLDGFYAQGAMKLRDVLAHFDGRSGTPLDRTELVLRFGQVDNGIEYREWTPGIVYWIRPSVPLKLAYSFRSGDRTDGELQLQLAFGF